MLLTKFTRNFSVLAAILLAPAAWAMPSFVTYEGVSDTAAGLTATRDAFRTAIGGGTIAGANGSFGGLRREINWDGVPNSLADPTALPADFFNVNSPRGVVFGTPGSGFMVSANAGAQAINFGFSSDFNTFSAQRLFTAINSNITDVFFRLPGTSTAATTTAFGLIFTDIEVAGQTKLEFFDAMDTLIYSHYALTTGNMGLGFLGATVTDGAISRVRITAGQNKILANGLLENPNDDVVAMDDFIYAEPAVRISVPEPSILALLGISLIGLKLVRRRRCGNGADRPATVLQLRT